MLSGQMKKQKDDFKVRDQDLIFAKQQFQEKHQENYQLDLKNQEMLQANEVLDKKNLILIDQVKFLKSQLQKNESMHNQKILEMGKEIALLKEEFQAFSYIEQELKQLQQVLIQKDKEIFLLKNQYEQLLL